MTKGTTNIHTYAIREILLLDFGIHLNKVGTRSKGQNQTVTPPEKFDIDNYMVNYNSKENIDSSEDNANIPQILLLSINRYHQPDGSNKINT
jgi:hypothetical protein